MAHWRTDRRPWLELSKPLIFLSAADDRFARLTSKSRQRDNAVENEQQQFAADGGAVPSRPAEHMVVARENRGLGRGR